MHTGAFDQRLDYIVSYLMLVLSIRLCMYMIIICHTALNLLGNNWQIASAGPGIHNHLPHTFAKAERHHATPHHLDVVEVGGVNRAPIQQATSRQIQ